MNENIQNEILSTKEQLVNNIREWVKIDGEISQLRQEIKERNNKKKTMTESLVNVMKTNNIDCFDINDGSLIYKKNKVRKPINAKTLLSSLQNYYKDQNVAEDLTKYIMDNREEQIKETIKRKVHK
jgi:predicted  nucleic acid-binding Zn-ribbon protein